MSWNVCFWWVENKQCRRVCLTRVWTKASKGSCIMSQHNILVNLIFIAMVTVAVLMSGCHRDRKVCRVCGYRLGWFPVHRGVAVFWLQPHGLFSRCLPVGWRMFDKWGGFLSFHFLHPLKWRFGLLLPGWCWTFSVCLLMVSWHKILEPSWLIFCYSRKSLNFLLELSL